MVCAGVHKIKGISLCFLLPLHTFCQKRPHAGLVPRTSVVYDKDSSVGLRDKVGSLCRSCRVGRREEEGYIYYRRRAKGVFGFSVRGFPERSF